jgi:RNA polymerase sigma factor (TIGR02999 family)
VTRVLNAAERGDPQASQRLLDVLYDELRELARARMAREPGGGAGMTLQATALVHEAYLRVVGGGGGGGGGADAGPPQVWQNRGHFFGAAALAMRRILVERARHRKRIRHGGGLNRVDLDGAAVVDDAADDRGGTDLLALEEALTKLERLDARKAKVVSLRYFAGLTVEETAAALDLSPSTVKNEWAFARAWLHRELGGDEGEA